LGVSSKSVEFFKNKTYSHVCGQCGKSTDYDTAKFAEDFKEKLKKLGITVK